MGIPTKLEEADDIEDAPELYQREMVVARSNMGGAIEEFPAYIYTGNNCRKSSLVPSGDWLSHKLADTSRTKLGPTESVADFIAAGYPEYRGQHGSYANSRRGGLEGMIDKMLRETEEIVSRSPEKQI